MTLALVILLALTRAEIIARMRAPVVTQADGLVQVYADCPEDLRGEFQSPVARYAADTMKTLYSGRSMKPVRFPKPEVLVHIGDVRTNDTRVITRVSTNGTRVITRLYLKSPAHADLDRFRIELVKAFARSVLKTEFSDAEAVKTYRAADPRLRVWDLRLELERWLAGRKVESDDEEMIRRMRAVLEPGRATRRDVLTFASRLFLYPPNCDERFVGGADSLSFREAIELADADPRVRLLAYAKANEIPIFGGGRSEELRDAAKDYEDFLRALALNETEKDDLVKLLDAADAKLCLALEKAK